MPPFRRAMAFTVQSLMGPARAFPRNAAMNGPTPEIRPTTPAPNPYPKAGFEKSVDTETESKTT